MNKLPLNSSISSRTSSSSGNKITTPTTTTPSKSNSLGRSASAGGPPSNGSASPRGATKPAQLPQGPAYSIAAGGQQNSVATPANSSSSPTATVPHQTHKDLPSLSQSHTHHGLSGAVTIATAASVPSSAIPTILGSGELSQQLSSPTQVSL